MSNPGLTPRNATYLDILEIKWHKGRKYVNFCKSVKSKKNLKNIGIVILEAFKLGEGPKSWISPQIVKFLPSKTGWFQIQDEFPNCYNGDEDVCRKKCENKLFKIKL